MAIPENMTQEEWDMLSPEDQQQMLDEEPDMTMLDNQIPKDKTATSTNPLPGQKPADAKTMFTPSTEDTPEANKPMDQKLYLQKALEKKVNPEIEALEKRAEGYAPNEFDSFKGDFASIMGSVGEANIRKAGAVADVDVSKSAEGWRGISEDAKRRLDLKAKMRSDLQARAQGLKKEDTDKRTQMIEELKARKALEDKELVKPEKKFTIVNKYDDKGRSTPMKVFADGTPPEPLGWINAPKSEQVSSMDKPLPKEFIAYLNKARVKLGREPYPENLTRTQLDQKQQEESTQYGQGAAIASQDPDNWEFSKASKPQQDAYKKAIADIDKIKSKSVESQKEMNLIRTAIETNQPMDINAAQRIIAQKFNKGALSENDVLAFSGSQNVFDVAKRWIGKRLGTGANLSAEDTKALEEMAKYIVLNEQEFVRKVIETKAREVDSEEAAGLGAGNKILKRYLSSSPQTPQTTTAPAQPQPVAQQPAQKTIAKKLYSASANKTKIVYSDGSEEIVDGKK